MTPLYEGKAKRLFATDRPDELLMEFKDSATAFNGAKKAEFENKGRFNKALTVLIYRALESRGVPTHFVRDAGEIAIVVKKVTIIPIELVVRNVIAGSLAKRLGRAEGEPLKQPFSLASGRFVRICRTFGPLAAHAASLAGVAAPITTPQCKCLTKPSGMANAAALVGRPPHPAEGEDAQQRRQREDHDDRRPGAVPADAAHEALAGRVDDLGERVVLGDRREPAGQ